MANRDRNEPYQGPGRFGQAVRNGGLWGVISTIPASILAAAGARDLKTNDKELYARLKEFEYRRRNPYPPASEVILEGHAYELGPNGERVSVGRGMPGQEFEMFAEREGHMYRVSPEALEAERKALGEALLKSKGGKLIIAAPILVGIGTLVGAVRGWGHAGKAKRQFENIRNDRDMAYARLESAERVAGALRQENVALGRIASRGGSYAAARMEEKQTAANAEQAL